MAIPYLKQETGGDSKRACTDARDREFAAISNIDARRKAYPRVSIFRDFAEDRRTSMDIYADGLAGALRDFAGSRFEVCEQLPRPLKFVPGKTGSLRMRISRNLYYPWFARRHRGDVNHIVDHGYAHLLQTLDPNRTVVTVHDLIPLLSWKGCLPGPTRYPHRPVLFERALGYVRRAGCVVADSESTRKDLVEHCGCEAGRIRVAYPGVPSWCRVYSAAERREARRNFGLPDFETRLILITGSELQWYKNHPTCIRVLARLVESCPWPVKMVRTGGVSREWLQLLAETGMQPHFVQIPRLDRHTAMADIYNSVDCLLFPSWYEGFGWPPLEAMACGVPVITSNAASLPEIVGDAGLMCAPDDIEELTKGVFSLLRRDGLNERFTEAGLKRAARFTWRVYAEQICQIYDSLIGGASCC